MSNVRPCYSFQGSVNAFQALPATPFTILVVDDSAVARATYIQYLKAASDVPYHFLQAGTLAVGLDLWRSHHPDIVLLDVRLPDGDGLQFLEMVGAEPSERRSPVIVLTGHGDERTAVRAMKLGAADYLVKGDITSVSLYTCINQVREHTTLMRQLLRSQRQEALLADIASRTRQHHDITEILSAIAHDTREFLKSDRILIYELSPDGKGEIVAEAIATPWASCLDTPRIDLSFPDDLSAACQEGSLFAVADIDLTHLSGEHVQRLQEAQVRAAVVMPILRPPKVNQPLWGLLIVHQCTSPRCWDESDVSFLQQLSVQLAIALHQTELDRSLQTLNASLEQKVEERTQELHAAYQRVNQELEERRRAEAALEQLALERQKTLLSLQESEQRYATLAASVPVGIFRTDAEGNCIYVNQRCCEITGLLPGCSLDFSWHRGIHPDDREKVVTEAARAFQESRSFLMEYRFLHPDGTVRWVLVQMEAEQDTSGHITGYVGSLTDISDRKQNEETARLLAAVVESSDDAIITKTLDGIITSWNAGAERLFGYTRAEAVGQPISMLFPLKPQDEEPSISERLQRGERIEHFETVRIHKDGNPVEVSITVSPLKNEAGRITGISKIIRDITERKRWEKALQESEAHHRALIDALPDLIMRINGAGVYLEFVATPNFDIVGNLPKMVGTHVFETLPPEAAQKRMEAVQRGLKTKTVQIYEQDLSIDGRTQVEEVRIVPYNDNEVLALVRDISDRKQAELALKQSEAQSSAILKAIPDLMMRLGIDGVYRAYMTQYQQLDVIQKGVNPIGQSMLNLLPPEMAERQWHYLNQAVQTGELQIYEQQIQLGDYLQHEEVRVIKSGDDEALFMIRDITERKRTEAALQQSEQTNRTIVESIPDLLIQMDCEGRYSRMLGGSGVRVRQPDWSATEPEIFNVLSQELAEQRLYYANRAIETGSLQVYEQIFNTGSESIHEEVRVAPLNEREVLIIIRDITDRKRAEAERLQAEKARVELHLLEQILDVVLAGYWDSDLVNQQEYLSPGFKRMFGYTDEELPNLPGIWETLIFPEDLPGTRECFKHHVQSRGVIPYYNEVRYRHKDGSTVWVICSGQVIEWDAEGNPLRMIGCHINISDRKQAEVERQRLIQELSDFKLALDEAAIVAITDAQGVITYVNDRFSAISGYSEEELIGQTHSLVNSGYHPPEFFRDLWSTIAQGEIWKGEICNRAKDGSLYWVESTLVPFLDAQGQPFQYLAVRFDITDRKLAEVTIQQENAFRQQIVENMAEGLCVCHALEELPYLRFTVWNQQMFQITGYTQEEINTLGWHILFPDMETQEQARTRMTRMHENDFLIAEEWDIQRQDGQRRTIAISTSLLSSSEGQLYVLALIQDITARKQAEKALQESQQFIQTVVNTVPLPLLWKNQQSVFLGCNQQLAKTLGLQSPDEIIGKTDFDFSPTPLEAEAYQAADRWVMEEEEPKLGIEETLTLPNGEQRWLETHKAPLRNWAGEVVGIVGMFQDITARKQAEAELQRTNEELAQATRLKDEFLATMSHELRTPLNAILGMTEGLVEAVFGEINSQQLRAIQTIERSGHHLLELINDILDIAKIESGQMELDCIPTAVTPLCNASMAFFKQQAEKKKIDLLLNLPSDLPYLWVDERRIRQVLINLLNNAVKFTPEGGQITLEVSLQEGKTLGDQSQRFLRLAVTDTGIGISPENIGKLFRPFIQIDSALNRKYEGTGLGLALVKRIVELHGGQVRLTSEVGAGSCFTIDLPCVPSAASGSESATSRKSMAATFVPDAGPLILLAEDNEANIGTISSYLQAKGYRILLAKRGQEAIALAQAQSPDLILMDIQMAGLDGLEAIAAIRQTPRLSSVPIITMTAFAMEGDRDRYLAAGANDYITKPIKLKQLVEAIADLLVPHGDDL
ncbi:MULTISPECIES: PAS domain S-box protein [unclassified Leptolyngbya]|uniref:PAS domain S-box protein n=1 Tax=unclassified Leptolyngbya TaxID=2650499 RepID=UPI0016830AFA|nr:MULTISPECIES: PAS domain S-box protein [unclassified Leptolyngbya]MBD1911620.1 PAS domain S-box protein [Leptolyngbya sp. FACHB-8]MBD2153185.1 PAS domain S-box protein [Leptolyngbya sp. FACHB-16]